MKRQQKEGEENEKQNAQVIKQKSRQNRVLDDFACQFYIIENENEKEKERRKGKRNRIRKKETGWRRGVKRSTEEQKEMKITCSTNVLAGFMLSLKSDCKFRRILAMDTEKNGKSHTHVNISQNENAEVKSISEET